MSFLLLIAALAANPPAPSCLLPDGTHVTLEVAVSDQERMLGLMYRDQLPSDHGMLFIFEADGIWPFWMKNTFIPLDLVWLDASGKVVEVRADVQPCRMDPCPSYRPRSEARTVLEVNAGAAARHGIVTGSRLRFSGVEGYPTSAGSEP
jgi:uncharacterized membrane protein (UPF0127 family)